MIAAPSIETIKAVVARHYGFNRSLRSRASMRARQIAMYLTRELTGWSTTEIGRAFGNADAVVREAVDAIDELAWNDPEVAATLKVLRTRLGVSRSPWPRR